MIGSIRGKITLSTDKYVIIETGGVGYKVNISPDTMAKVETLRHKSPQSEILLWVYSHIREDMFDLYGFLERAEQDFFEMLISVSGIGPKGALSILSVASIETLKKAISTSDTGYLTKISGIGRKTAEKIVIELRDKVGKETEGTSLREEMDALEALKSLGYSQNEARDALKEVSASLSTNAKIKEALKILGNK